jgi:sec-independent protein translocase protein TatB
MFDMSWGEVMLIGGVALIVIGPKDLPKALRTLGQIKGKVVRMAGEFNAQFNEAIRESELDEVRNEIDGMRRSANTVGPTFDPIQTIRSEIKGAAEGRAQSSTQPLANVAAQLDAAEAAKGASPGTYDVPAPPAAAPPEPAAPVQSGAAAP